MERVQEKNLNTVEYWNEQHRRGLTGWDTLEAVCEALLAIDPEQGATIGDIGAGHGDVLIGLSKIRPDLKLVAIDHSQVALERLASCPIPIRTVLMDILSPVVGWGEGELLFDLVVSTETLEHLERPQEAIDNMVRVARAWMIITTPNENRVRSVEHVWSFTRDDLQEMLVKHGSAEVKPILNDYLLLGVVNVRR